MCWILFKYSSDVYDGTTTTAAKKNLWVILRYKYINEPFADVISK